MDLLLINLPRISLVYPPAAPSLLKSVAEHAGFSACVKDYNLNLFSELDDTDIFNTVSNYFTLSNLQVESHIQILIENFYQKTIEDILTINPNFLRELSTFKLIDFREQG